MWTPWIKLGEEGEGIGRSATRFSPRRSSQFSSRCENASWRVPKTSAKKQGAAFAAPLVSAEPN